MSKSDAIPASLQQRVNWGFVSTANICKKNAIGAQQSGLGQCYAVASRDSEKAKRFAEECHFQKHYSSYDDLLNDSQVDAIYLPTPTTHREQYALECIKRGKHLLIEKPVCSTQQQVNDILQLAEKHGVKWLDGVHFQHNPRTAYVRSVLNDKQRFGELKYVHATMSFNGMDEEQYLNNNIRLDSSLEPLGALGDIGWYTVRGILYAVQYDVPLTVSASATFYDRSTKQYSNTVAPGSSVNAVIIEASALISFHNGVTGTMNFSFNAPYRNALDVTGSRGRVHIPDFVSPANPNQSSFLFFHTPEQHAEQKEAESKTYAANETKQNIQQVEAAKATAASVNEMESRVTVKHSQSQVALLMRNASRLVMSQKVDFKSASQKEAEKHEVPAYVGGVHNFDREQVVIDSDSDAQLSVLQDYETSLIDYPHLSLLTQACMDAINQSALSGGKVVAVKYQGERSRHQQSLQKS